MNNIDTFRDYFNAHINEANLDSVKECEEQIRQAPSPFFTLTCVPYEAFYEEYHFRSTDIRLNAISFPYAVINVVQGIYHLALGIITFSKVRLYTAVRDFEEAYGRILKMGNKTKSEFHVQRALFHKRSYEIYSKGPRIDPLVERGVTIAHALDAKRTDFKQFLKNPDFTIAKFKLEETIKKAGGAKFIERLNTLDYDLLSNLTVYQFLLDPEAYVKFYLISDDEFAAITLDQIKELNESHLDYLWERYLSFKGSSKSPSEVIDINAIIKGKIDPNTLVKELPSELYGLIPVSQLHQIDFSQLGDMQIRSLFDRPRNELEGITTLLRALPLAVVRKVPKFLACISNDQLKEFKDITIEELNAIFLDAFSADKARFALLSKEALQSVLPQLDGKFLGAISDEQLKELDLTVLNKEQLSCLFYWKKNSRIQLLDVKTIIALSDKLDCLAYISEVQLKALDFSKLSRTAIQNIVGYYDEEKRRKIIQSLSTEQLVIALPHMYYMQDITDDQIKQLPFEKMDNNALKGLFDPTSTKEATRRFDLVKNRMADILPKLKNLEGVPDDIVQNFDVSLLSTDQLKSLLRLSIFSDNPRAHLLRDEQWKPFLRSDLVKHIPDSILVKFIDELDKEAIKTISYSKEDLFLRLDEVKLNSVLKKYHCLRLSDEQVPLIDFSSLSEKAISDILRNLYFGEINRGHLLTDKQLQCLASRGVKDIRPTKQQFEKIDFSKLSGKAIKTLLTWQAYSWVTIKQIEDAFAIDKDCLNYADLAYQKNRLGLSDSRLNAMRLQSSSRC